MRTERVTAAALALWAGVALAHGNGAGHSHAAAPAGAAPRTAAAPVGAAGETLRVASSLITVAAAERRRAVERRAGIGRVAAGAGAMHDVNAYFSGQVQEIFVRAGDRVRRGDPVALIASPEFVLTQKSYLALLKNQEKLDILSEEGRLPDYLKDAKENLRWWGIDDRQIAALEKSGEAADGIAVRAPTGGVISEVLVRPGDLVNAGDRAMAQFVVFGRPVARLLADDRPLWLEGLLFPAQLDGVDTARARVAITLPDRGTLERPVAGIAPGLDASRQLVRLMAELGDAEGLHVGQPLRFELLVERPEAVWVPRAAVLGGGDQAALFVRRGAGLYERRAVRPGPAAGAWVPVEGLTPGVAVVTRGKMMLEGARRLAPAATAGDPEGRHSGHRH